MDSAFLQLFTLEEILERVGRKQLTGCFHVFTAKESANIFFKDGLVLAAVKGKAEGEGVLSHVLSWKDARFLWQPKPSTTPPTSQPLNINIHDFLAKRQPLAQTASVPHPVISIPSKGKSTGPLPEAAKPKSVTTNAVDLTATKTFSPTAEARASHDEALLKKYQVALVSIDHPDERHKVTRVSSLIGRNPACDIAISHPSISRQHCMLQLTDRGLLAKDLDTPNGTKVNGIMLKEGYVSVGDKLTLGHLVYALEKA